MKYVSAGRLHRALVNLRAWGSATGQQQTHLAVFLASKLKGMNAAAPVEFRDPEDENVYWNRFMRLRGDDHPFFDPGAGEYRPVTYPHNGAFKQRADRWPTAEYEIATRNGDEWQFQANYVERLRDKPFTRSGVVHKAPVPDLVAWLYRWEAFDDADTVGDAIQRFKADFHLTDNEFGQLFDPTAADGNPETDEDFFAERKVSEDLVVEMAKQGGAFNMVEAQELIAERSGAQPVAFDDVVRLLTEGRRQVILQGPPGTGKTYLARQVAARMLGATDPQVADGGQLSGFLANWQVPADGQMPAGAPGVWDIVQFHPSYTYEDFVRGISSEIDGGHPVFRATNRTVGSLAALADTTDLPVVLIVDEINRGDLAKVLGELIFALEYRGESVRTPYEVDGSTLIRLPANLYVVATMNTADRSIALIDYAIRRRFDFVDVGASRDALEQYLVSNSVALDRTERVLSLFDAVNEPLGDERDYQVGHTYFMATDMGAIAERLVFQVLPLLAEYRREGMIGENVRVRPLGWASERGIPLVPPTPFDLVQSVETWLSA